MPDAAELLVAAPDAPTIHTARTSQGTPPKLEALFQTMLANATTAEQPATAAPAPTAIGTAAGNATAQQPPRRSDATLTPLVLLQPLLAGTGTQAIMVLGKGKEPPQQTKASEPHKPTKRDSAPSSPSAPTAALPLLPAPVLAVPAPPILPPPPVLENASSAKPISQPPATATAHPEPRGSPTPGRPSTSTQAEPIARPITPAPNIGASSTAPALLQPPPLAPSPPAPPPPSAATGAAPRPPLPPVTDQVAPAIVSFGRGPDAPITIHLTPAELGQVQIALSRAPDGTPVLHVGAERPETLALLQADQAQLHTALDQAGIARQGRSVEFQIIQPLPNAGAVAAPPSTADTTSRDRAFAENPGLLFNDTGRGGASDGRRRRTGTAVRAAAGIAPRRLWLRAGIDITA